MSKTDSNLWHRTASNTIEQHGRQLVGAGTAPAGMSSSSKPSNSARALRRTETLRMLRQDNARLCVCECEPKRRCQRDFLTFDAPCLCAILCPSVVHLGSKSIHSVGSGLGLQLPARGFGKACHGCLNVSTSICIDALPALA